MSNEKQTQEEIVLEIVRLEEPIRTETVKILAMRRGVSCADRYLRYLQNKGMIEGYRMKGDSTKTWRRRDYSPTLNELPNV